MNLFGANFFAPEVEGFPHFEAGKEGDTDQLAVVLVLLFPNLKGKGLFGVTICLHRILECDEKTQSKKNFLLQVANLKSVNNALVL